MRRIIVLGCSVLFAVAAGCGGGTSNRGGTGGAGGDGGAGMGGGGAGGIVGRGGTGGAGGDGTGGTSAGGGGGVAGTSTGGLGGTTGAGGTSSSTMLYTITLTSADALTFAAGLSANVGTWMPLTATGGTQSYSFSMIGLGGYGVAYGCASAAGDRIAITVIHASVLETTNISVACGGLSTASPVTIAGTIAGLSSTQTAQIDIASNSASVEAATPTYSLSVPAGTWDLFARRMTAAPVWDRMIRRNSVTAAAGATFNLDFAAEGFAPETRTVTFDGVSATETTSVLAIFRNTLGGSPFGLGSPSAGSYFAIPGAQLRSGDYHSVVAGATDASTNTNRRVRRIFTAAADFTATMPPLDPGIAVSPGQSTPYVRPRLAFPTTPVADRYDVTLSQTETAPARTRSWTVQATPTWIRGAPANYELPDLSGIPGFQAWWGLGVGAADYQQFLNWSNASRDAADLLRNDQTAAELEGREYKTVQRSGQVTF